MTILPPNYIETDQPMVFLAGPIKGAYDWQQQAIEYFRKHAPHLVIASPRRKYLPGTFVYAEQVDWETYHLNKSAKTGVVMFFLAKEETHICERAYAQTTRFELGEWKVKHETEGCNLVVGIEEGFTNHRYIRRRLSQDCPKVPMPDSVEATCDAVIELIIDN